MSGSVNISNLRPHLMHLLSECHLRIAMVTTAVALPNLDKFSHFGLFSGGTLAPDQISDTSKVKLVFMSYGSRERGSERVKEAADVLNKAGIKSVSYISPLTAHEWQSWRRSLREFAPLLFKN